MIYLLMMTAYAAGGLTLGGVVFLNLPMLVAGILLTALSAVLTIHETLGGRY